jgi:transposase
MLALSDSRRYFFYNGIADMRRGFDSLSGLVRKEFGKDPLSGDIFVFFNRRRNQIKLLLWEGDGFSMYYKRLERGTYEVPLSDKNSSSIEIRSQELMLILQGIVLSSVKKRKRYKKS